MDEETIVKKKGEVLKEFVLKKYAQGKEYWQPFRDNWADIKKEYVGVLNEAKEDWQGNVIVPTLEGSPQSRITLYLYAVIKGCRVI